MKRNIDHYNLDMIKPFVGMTNFKGNYVTKDDVKIAKNYLTELELKRLNLLVSGFLDFALILLARRLIFYALLNFSFGCLQRGQRQSSGKSSNGVPGAIPCFASPCAGS